MRASSTSRTLTGPAPFSHCDDHFFQTRAAVFHCLRWPVLNSTGSTVGVTVASVRRVALRATITARGIRRQDAGLGATSTSSGLFGHGSRLISPVLHERFGRRPAALSLCATSGCLPCGRHGSLRDGSGG